MKLPADSVTLAAMEKLRRWILLGGQNARSSPGGSRPTVWAALAGFILIVLLGVALTVWMGRRADRVRRNNLLRQAQTASAAITPESVLRLTASVADTASPDYRTLCEQLRSIRAVSADTRFVYLLAERGGHVVFLAESEPEESADHSPPGMVYEEASDDLKAAFKTGRSFTEGPLRDQYGVWITAFSPVRDPRTTVVMAVLGVDCDARDWHLAVWRSGWAPLLITLLAAVLWSVLMVWLRFMQLSASRIAASAQRLRESEERLKAALFGARQSLWDWSLSDNALYFDAQWGVLFETASSEPPRHIDAWRDMIHPDDLPAVLNAMRSALASPETTPFEAEYRVRGKSEEWIDILDRARVTERDADGHPTRMTGTIQDITSRKRAERMLQERADELERVNRLLNARESRVVELKNEVNRLLAERGRPMRYGEEIGAEPIPSTGGLTPSHGPHRNMVSVMEDLEATNRHLQTEIKERRQTEDRLRELSQAVEQSPVSVIITDPEGIILYVNPTFTEVSGFPAEGVIGRKPSILKSGKYPPDFYRTLWETIRAGQTWRGELENCRKDGSFFWEYAVISPIFDSRGLIVRFLAVKQDITDRRNADEQMRRTVTEMEQMNRLMTGREERVLELKAEVNVLCRALGQTDAYRVTLRSDTSQDLTRPPSPAPVAGDTPT